LNKDYSLGLKFYKIINGFFYITINNVKYKIIYADNQIKYEAEMLYFSLMNDSRFDTEYLTDSEVQHMLISNGSWSEEQEDKLKKIEDQIDKLKIKLCTYYTDISVNKQAKEEIATLKTYKDELLTNKHSLDYLTLNFFATNIKNKYIISQCVLREDGSNVFGKSYENFDIRLLDQIITEINKYHTITGEELREICLGELWYRYSSCKDSIFGPLIDLNDDQINLISLTRMYENVRNHPECPSDSLIRDNDALDGWFLIQKDKAQKNKKKNESLSKVRGKVKGHDFVYVITQNKEEAAAIESLNDFRGKQLVDNVRNSVTIGESKKWKDIPFIKQELQSEIYRNQKQGLPK